MILERYTYSLPTFTLQHGILPRQTLYVRDAPNPELETRFKDALAIFKIRVRKLENIHRPLLVNDKQALGVMLQVLIQAHNELVKDRKLNN